MADFKAMMEAKRLAKLAAEGKTDAPKQEVTEVAKAVITTTADAFVPDNPVKVLESVVTEPAKKSFKELMAERNAAMKATVEMDTQSQTGKVFIAVYPASEKGDQTVVVQANPTQATEEKQTGSISPVAALAGNVEAPSVASDIMQNNASIPPLSLTQVTPTGTNAADDQAYADISSRIEQLEAMEDEALAGKMSELKKALMANPNAVALMLDTDIGKMVIALRRLTKEAQVEAVKEKAAKKTGSSKKQKAFVIDADTLGAVFDEL